jgi:hypothetical protein
VTYTAPDILSGMTSVVVAEDSEYAQYAGHAIIDIAGQEQDAWSRIEGVSTPGLPPSLAAAAHSCTETMPSRLPLSFSSPAISW